MKQRIERKDEHQLIVYLKSWGSKFDSLSSTANCRVVTQHVSVLPTEEFERQKASHRPSGYWEIGLNAGAPRDGLVEFVGKSTGVRYLVDSTGGEMIRLFADEATCPPVGGVIEF